MDLLCEQPSSTHLKVILTQTVDVTFLPAVKSVVSDYYKDEQRILECWDQKLREVAAGWGHGAIYVFDTNAVMMDCIRDYQLYAAGIEAENGLGKNQDPGWENIVDSVSKPESRS